MLYEVITLHAISMFNGLRLLLISWHISKQILLNPSNSAEKSVIDGNNTTNSRLKKSETAIEISEGNPFL